MFPSVQILNRYAKHILGVDLGVKSLFNFTLDGGLTAPKETESTRLEVPKSTEVDLLG